MNVFTFSFVVLGAVCTAATLALLAYRAKLTYHEDLSIHTDITESNLTDRQRTVARCLVWIDRVGPILTVVALLYGLVLAMVYLYVPWVSSRLAA